MNDTPAERWFWCDIHYACFGFASRCGVIVHTAPIFGWAKGKTLQQVKPWLVKKKARVIELKTKQHG